MDGRDISGIPLPKLRALITLVPQDPWLHAGTIAENIGYGRAGATGTQIAAAAAAAAHRQAPRPPACSRWTCPPSE